MLARTVLERDECCFRSGAARVTGDVRRFNRRPKKARRDDRCTGQWVRRDRDWIGGPRKVTQSRFKSDQQPRHRPEALPRQSDGTGGSSPDKPGQRYCRSSRPLRAQSVAGHLEDRHSKIEVPVIRAGDELILVLREQRPAPYLVPDRVIAPSVDWLGQVCVGHAGNAERLYQTGPQDQELLENLRQVAERRRIDQNNVLLRSAPRHFKTVTVVYTRQAVSEPAPRR